MYEIDLLEDGEGQSKPIFSIRPYTKSKDVFFDEEMRFAELSEEEQEAEVEEHYNLEGLRLLA